MAHKIQQEFCLRIKRELPEYFKDKIVLDVGSGDVNGNNRYLFKDCFILGVDVALGPNVDIVDNAHNLKFVDNFFDTAISTECFEHDQYWIGTIKNIIRMLKNEGLFLFTCATTGRPEHGTLKSKPYQSFATRIGIDYYKNLTEDDIRQNINIEKYFSQFEFIVKAQDLYFWGIKK